MSILDRLRELELAHVLEMVSQIDDHFRVLVLRCDDPDDGDGYGTVVLGRGEVETLVKLSVNIMGLFARFGMSVDQARTLVQTEGVGQAEAESAEGDEPDPASGESQHTDFQEAPDTSKTPEPDPVKEISHNVFDQLREAVRIDSEEKWLCAFCSTPHLVKDMGVCPACNRVICNIHFVNNIPHRAVCQDCHGQPVSDQAD